MLCINRGQIKAIIDLKSYINGGQIKTIMDLKSNLHLLASCYFPGVLSMEIGPYATHLDS